MVTGHKNTLFMVLSQKPEHVRIFSFFVAINMARISFKGKHFNKDMILMSIRWYVGYALSYRDIEELMAERGVEVDHSTINRWVISYAPQLKANFSKYKKPVHSSWRMDETYIKVKGEWTYLYRAVDKHGKTIDFMLAKKRDEAAASAFFKKAINSSGLPEKVVIDKSGSNIAAINNINLELFVYGLWLLMIEDIQVKYLNNIVEQDHRFIKKITKPMKGFKAFHSAASTLDGIELHHMLRKCQADMKQTSIHEQFYALAA
jgi:putative transposase